MPPIEEYDTEIDTLQKDISSYNSQIRNLQAVTDRITQDIDNYSNIVDSKKTYYLNKVQEEIIPIQQQIDKNSEDIIPIMSRLTMLNNEIERAKNITDVCPTCGQHIEGVTLPDTSHMEEEVIILSAKYKEICDINSSLKISIEEIRKNCSNQLLLELSDIDSTVSDLKRKLSEYSANMKDVQAKLNISEVILATTLANKESYNITLANLQEDFSKCICESEKENENIVYNTKGKQSTQERLDAINKMITVTNRDFRGFLLTNVIQFIDKQSKSYCKDIFDTDKIQFTLEGNNISIR